MEKVRDKQVRETCWNCDKLLGECNCSKTETYNNEGVVCPYCGRLHTADCDFDGFYSQDVEEFECDECEEEFTFIGTMSWSYKATRKEN